MTAKSNVRTTVRSDERQHPRRTPQRPRGGGDDRDSCDEYSPARSGRSSDLGGGRTIQGDHRQRTASTRRRGHDDLGPDSRSYAHQVADQAPVAHETCSPKTGSTGSGTGASGCPGGRDAGGRRAVSSREIAGGPDPLGAGHLAPEGAVVDLVLVLDVGAYCCQSSCRALPTRRGSAWWEVSRWCLPSYRSTAHRANRVGIRAPIDSQRARLRLPCTAA